MTEADLLRETTIDQISAAVKHVCSTFYAPPCSTNYIHKTDTAYTIVESRNWGWYWLRKF